MLYACSTKLLVDSELVLKRAINLDGYFRSISVYSNKTKVPYSNCIEVLVSIGDWKVFFLCPRLTLKSSIFQDWTPRHKEG